MAASNQPQWFSWRIVMAIVKWGSKKVWDEKDRVGECGERRGFSLIVDSSGCTVSDVGTGTCLSPGFRVLDLENGTFLSLDFLSSRIICGVGVRYGSNRRSSRLLLVLGESSLNVISIFCARAWRRARAMRSHTTHAIGLSMQNNMPVLVVS
jgi:hypothetical protein